MLNLSNVYVKYGDRVLLNKINATIRPGERVGLIGRNGAGKSTILSLISGDQTPDEGSIERPKEMTLGFLRQVLNFTKEHSVMDEAMLAFEAYRNLENQLNQLNTELTERTDYESDDYARLIQKVTDISDRLHRESAENPEAQASRILKGLGFKQADLHMPLKTFSGGWLMRVEMAKLLLQNPDLLLLDEPTNHLDIESIVWMENYLKNYNGIIILISHDKEFLNNVTNRTIEIELGRLMDIKVPYSKFMIQKQSQAEINKSSYENQQKEIAHKERLIEKFRAKASKAKLAQSLIKQLDGMDRIEVFGEDTKVMRIRFPEPPRTGREVVKIDSLSKSYGDNEVLRNISLTIERGDRVAFVGQNGQGKSTLAKIITNHTAASSGNLKVHENTALGYYSQDHHETLSEKATLYDTLFDHTPPAQTSKVRNVLGSFLFSGEDIDKKVQVLSGGERARLALACMVVNPSNLLILDEPTNHLDILSKETLKDALLSYQGTLIVVSHDRDFLAGLTDKTYEFADHRIKEYLGDINYFLEKKSADNFREVEKNYAGKKPKSTSEVKAKTQDNSQREDYKKIERAIANVERKIKSTEDKIKKKETLMGATDFYGSENQDQVISSYDKLKSELNLMESEWEKLIEALDNLA